MIDDLIDSVMKKCKQNQTSSSSSQELDDRCSHWFFHEGFREVHPCHWTTQRHPMLSSVKSSDSSDSL